MILADTSIWSGHFRRRNDRLVRLLEEQSVVLHPWIVGELALGPGLRLEVLEDLEAMPTCAAVSDRALLAFVKLHALRGIGWVDAQLLVSALESRLELWTSDALLARLAKRFGVAAGE